MWGKKNDDGGESLIRQIEGLTSFTWEVIDLYHAGIGRDAHEPMSPSLAKSMIADEINRQLGGKLLAEEWKHARLRISGPDSVAILTALHELVPAGVVTVRWVGARHEEDDQVVYATIKCSDVEELTQVMQGLEERSLEVRDGTFGLFVR